MQEYPVYIVRFFVTQIATILFSNILRYLDMSFIREENLEKSVSTSNQRNFFAIHSLWVTVLKLTLFYIAKVQIAMQNAQTL